jgi:hypothetical protein
MTMNRWALIWGLLLVGTEAVAQAIEPGGVNVRFEQVQNKLTIRAQIYLNDGDRVVETSDLPVSQEYAAKQNGGIPVNKFTIVTVCAYDYPGTTGCPSLQESPAVPRFNVDQGEAIGITSQADGNTASKKRINGGTEAVGSGRQHRANEPDFQLHHRGMRLVDHERPPDSEPHRWFGPDGSAVPDYWRKNRPWWSDRDQPWRHEHPRGHGDLLGQQFDHRPH